MRSGAGSGFQGDRLEPAVILAERALDTGVTTSITIDPHGKTLSYALLEMAIEA